MQENKETFLTHYKGNLGKTSELLIRGAYIFAKYGHRFQKRREVDRDGKPVRYFEHCRRVAIRTMEAGVTDTNLIIAGLLHDCLEDTDDIDAPLIGQFFGFEVMDIVEAVSKGPEDHGAADLTPYFLRIVHKGPNAIRVKFFDRSDNLDSIPADEPTFAARYIAVSDMMFDMFKSHISRADPAVCAFLSALNGAKFRWNVRPFTG